MSATDVDVGDRAADYLRVAAIPQPPGVPQESQAMTLMAIETWYLLALALGM